VSSVSTAELLTGLDEPEIAAPGTWSKDPHAHPDTFRTMKAGVYATLALFIATATSIELWEKDQGQQTSSVLTSFSVLSRQRSITLAEARAIALEVLAAAEAARLRAGQEEARQWIDLEEAT
jgi:hypothetical protein